MTRRLIIDMSSLLWQSLLTSKDVEFGKEVEHEGKKVHVNGWQHGYECAINHLVAVMGELGVAPINCVFVVEGERNDARRKVFYSGYKVGRDSRPPLAYEQFRILRDKLCEVFGGLGAQVCTQAGVEADDIIAYLARHLDGEKVILSTDGDMAALITDDIALWRKDMLTRENPYGPFPCKYIGIYKALCGDGNEYKGAAGFGPKAFLDMFVTYGEAGLAALERMLKRGLEAGKQACETPGTLIDLEEDVPDFKPFRKVIDSAAHVYQSYFCALLHDEWVDTKRQPLLVKTGTVVDRDQIEDPRLRKFAAQNTESWLDKTLHPSKQKGDVKHAVFDCELIGEDCPVFLVCAKIIETGKQFSFWWHKEGDMQALKTMLNRPDLTWISFNGIHFDAPLISAALAGRDPHELKKMANAIIMEGEKSWDMPSRFNYDPVEFDHIDLMEVAPGVRTSLKTYAGRMGYPTMVDLPFHHDQDLDNDQLLVLERYCQNDLGVTEALFNRLRAEIDLRQEMSEEHGIDLRSKSDAQVAEAVLKKAAGIKGRVSGQPYSVTYKAPAFIETDSEVVQDLIERLNRTEFKINKMNGQIETPEFLKEPLALGSGIYQCGIGGLHSTHDKQLYVKTTDDLLISDFDVASYYPNIMLKAGLTPKLDGDAGSRFIEAYRDIYTRRIEAKHTGNIKVSNALKISLNGTFGKLGSPYSSFYSPDLMLAVTLTGQLNLLCLIYDMGFHPSIKVLSANTDGITVQYPVKYRERLLAKIADNADRTGFEYEETQYRVVAMKDVNNYIAVTTNGKVKRKGLYAEPSLMKNPTASVCSHMATDFLKDGISPAESIAKYTGMLDFVSIRVVKGGGIQYEQVMDVDDWECVKDVGTKDNEWRRPCWPEGKVVKRKSRPKPVEVGVGGKPFGRIARWYMATGDQPPINYLVSGNKVPKTEGAKICMTLPDALPADLDQGWYIREAEAMLEDMGVPHSEIVDALLRYRERLNAEGYGIIDNFALCELNDTTSVSV